MIQLSLVSCFVLVSFVPVFPALPREPFTVNYEEHSSDFLEILSAEKEAEHSLTKSNSEQEKAEPQKTLNLRPIVGKKNSTKVNKKHEGLSTALLIYRVWIFLHTILDWRNSNKFTVQK